MSRSSPFVLRPGCLTIKVDGDGAEAQGEEEEGGRGKREDVDTQEARTGVPTQAPRQQPRRPAPISLRRAAHGGRAGRTARRAPAPPRRPTSAGCWPIRSVNASNSFWVLALRNLAAPPKAKRQGTTTMHDVRGMCARGERGGLARWAREPAAEDREKQHDGGEDHAPVVHEHDMTALHQTSPGSTAGAADGGGSLGGSGVAPQTSGAAVPRILLNTSGPSVAPAARS
ncbi:unnamed protein product [Prorocentrum cordatum]|uniref:Uncharacterized protein n=1 Tax=Prorocentrum cordatum TaxID=2364126 RepID=A0ABN9YIG5_9DINO|nr:unnamed protein product [Polarella glacialis]